MTRTRRVPILETPVNSSETSGLRRAYISKGLEVNRYVSRGTMRAIFVESFSLEGSASVLRNFFGKKMRTISSKPVNRLTRENGQEENGLKGNLLNERRW